MEYYEKILKKQPITPEYDSVVNLSEYNSLDGFTTAITPFNFTAIGGNLSTAPLLFGNSVLWKPSNNAVLSNYLFYEIMLEAGLPRGILNFCPMEPEEFFNLVNNRNDLSAVLFTGSSSVFNDIYYQVARRIHNRDNYTRLIGETGGKNFHFVDDTYRENLITLWMRQFKGIWIFRSKVQCVFNSVSSRKILSIYTTFIKKN